MDGAALIASDDLYRQVVGILATQTLRAPSDLTAQTALDSLGLDSLGMAEVLFAIEESFDVSVPFNANTDATGRLDLSTVGTLCAEVEALIRAQRG